MINAAFSKTVVLFFKFFNPRQLPKRIWSHQFLLHVWMRRKEIPVQSALSSGPMLGTTVCLHCGVDTSLATPALRGGSRDRQGSALR